MQSFPIAASVFSDPHLLTRHRLALRERGPVILLGHSLGGST